MLLNKEADRTILNSPFNNNRILHGWGVEDSGPRVGQTCLPHPPMLDSFSYFYRPKYTYYMYREKSQNRGNVLTMFVVYVDDVG